MTQSWNHWAGSFLLVAAMIGTSPSLYAEDKPDNAAAEEAAKKKLLDILLGDKRDDPEYEVLKKEVLAKQQADKPVDAAEVETFIKEVAALGPKEQIRRVEAKLKELNPEWNDLEANYVLDAKKEKVIEYALSTATYPAPQVKVIWPIRALAGVEKLNLNGSKIANLDPISGLPLTSLGIADTKVSNLAPLKGMALTALNISHSKVTDLTPLKDAPLNWLDLSYTDLSDLSPVTGMKLVLLNCSGSPISDLSPLNGMPLAWLDLTKTKITDLAPLKGMPLKSLRTGKTAIVDLAPLTGMKLTALDIGETKVEDLAPLKGMPLNSLVMYQTEVTDVTPLTGMPLQSLYCDFKPEYAEVLKGIATLKTLNGKPPEKSFARTDAQNK